MNTKCAVKIILSTKNRSLISVKMNKSGENTGIECNALYSANILLKQLTVEITEHFFCTVLTFVLCFFLSDLRCKIDRTYVISSFQRERKQTYALIYVHFSIEVYIFIKNDIYDFTRCQNKYRLFLRHSLCFRQTDRHGL
jgi:hypothetical protein